MARTTLILLSASFSRVLFTRGSNPALTEQRLLNAASAPSQWIGRQFVAVSVGSGSEDATAPNLSRLLVFALDGTAQLPP